MSHLQPSFIIDMFKPTLKRSNPSQITVSALQKPPNEYWQLPQRNHSNLSKGQLVTTSLLRAPANEPKLPTIFTPLFALPHQYPPEILGVLNNESAVRLGSYKEINWLASGKRLWFWVTGQLTCSTFDSQAQIISLAMGQLSCPGLPLRVRNSYLLALGVKNQVVVMAVEPYPLRVRETGLRYTLSSTWEIQHISFHKQKTLLIYSAPDFLQIIQLSESRRTFQTQLPFYKRFLPTRFTPPSKTIDNLLYSEDYVYLLCSEQRRPSWISKTLSNLWQDNKEDTLTHRFIQVHQVKSSPTPSIEYIYSISEKDLTQRLRGSLGIKEEIRITNIFLSGQSKQTELGIITEGGLFLTLRKDTNRAYLSRDPLLCSHSSSMESLFLMSQVKAFCDASSTDSARISQSLGFNNLSATDDSIMWISSQRIDSVRSQGVVGSISLTRNDAENCYLFGHPEWRVFSESSFYSVRHSPLRHLLIATFHASLHHFDSYHSLPLEASIRKLLERLQSSLTAPRLLKELIQIVICGEKYISVNNIVFEVLQRELRGESPQNYLDWSHELRPSMSKQQIAVSEQILTKVWNLIFTLQYKELKVPQNSSKPISETSTYWLAVHSIFHSLVAPIFNLRPRDFRDSRMLIENTFDALSSLRSFFQLKQAHQASIRELSLSRARSAPFGSDFSLNATRASIEKQSSDMSWVEEGVRKLVSNKIFGRGQLQAEERLIGAVEATLNLMTLFFSLSHHQIRLPAFGEVLKSKSQQELLAKKLLDICQLGSLAEINSKMPQLGLEKHITFRRWSENARRESLPPSKIVLKELAEIASSPYFEQMLAILENRWDLHLETLELYETTLTSRREALVQSNTLKERHILSSAIFPEDREISLTNDREYYDSQLGRAAEEKKRVIELAVRELPVDRTTSCDSLMNKLIEVACKKPDLHEHLVNCFREQGRIDKLAILQKVSLSNGGLRSRSSGASRFTRQLFPDLH